MEQQTESNGMSTGLIFTILAAVALVAIVLWGFFTGSDPLGLF